MRCNIDRQALDRITLAIIQAAIENVASKWSPKIWFRSFTRAGLSMGITASISLSKTQ